jgi:hypothetical protein
LDNKPNFPSVMNYLFQFVGITINGIPGQYRYSEVLAAMNENAVIDTDGISKDPAYSGYRSAHLCPNGDLALIDSLADPVRWDCQSLPPQNRMKMFDLNRDGAISPLPGNKDWPGSASSASWVSAGGAPFPLVPPAHEQATDQALVQTGALTSPAHRRPRRQLDQPQLVANSAQAGARISGF